MGMLTNKPNNTNPTQAAKAPRDRFIIGSSECYFEAAQYMTGHIDVAKAKALFNNERTSLKETEGKSLKVLFRTENEMKFIGFVTAGDASLTLDNEDIATVMKHATTEDITKAITAEELASMF